MARVRSGGGGAAYAWSLVFFGAGFLICLLLAIIFFTQVNGANERAAEAEGELARFATPAQRTGPSVLPLLENRGQTVVGQLLDENGTLKAVIVGDRQVSADALNQSINNLGVTGTLVNEVNTLRAELQAAQQSVTQAQQARDAATANAQAAEAASNQMLTTFRQTMTELKNQVGEQGDAATDYLGKINAMEAAFTQQIVAIRADMQQQLSEKDNQIAGLQREARQLENKLKERLSSQLTIGQNTDPDARIVSVFDDGKRVYIDRGLRDRVMLGLTFEVFPSGELISLDEFDELRGIATIQVVDISETSSIANIVRKQRGATIKAGDVAANLAYNPNAEPKFYVYGDFDIDNRGEATLADRQRIENMITRYGGAVVEQLGPDVDFLVLGQEPALPEQPPENTTDRTILQAFVQATQDYETYQNLKAEAVALGIPVLNQNRFLPLVGYYQR